MRMVFTLYRNRFEMADGRIFSIEWNERSDGSLDPDVLSSDLRYYLDGEEVEEDSLPKGLLALTDKMMLGADAIDVTNQAYE